MIIWLCPAAGHSKYDRYLARCNRYHGNLTALYGALSRLEQLHIRF
jgi:hypothetical protein